MTDLDNEIPEYSDITLTATYAFAHIILYYRHMSRLVEAMAIDGSKLRRRAGQYEWCAI